MFEIAPDPKRSADESRSRKLASVLSSMITHSEPEAISNVGALPGKASEAGLIESRPHADRPSPEHPGSHASRRSRGRKDYEITLKEVTKPD